MCATKIGKVCASDHALNAAEEMAAMNDGIKKKKYTARRTRRFRSESLSAASPGSIPKRHTRLSVSSLIQANILRNRSTSLIVSLIMYVSMAHWISEKWLTMNLPEA